MIRSRWIIAARSPYDQAAIAGARERRDGALDLGHVANADGAHLDAERRRDRLDDGKLTDPGGYRRDRAGPPHASSPARSP